MKYKSRYIYKSLLSFFICIFHTVPTFSEVGFVLGCSYRFSLNFTSLLLSLYSVLACSQTHRTFPWERAGRHISNVRTHTRIHSHTRAGIILWEQKCLNEGVCVRKTEWVSVCVREECVCLVCFLSYTTTHTTIYRCNHLHTLQLIHIATEHRSTLKLYRFTIIAEKTVLHTSDSLLCVRECKTEVFERGLLQKPNC